MDFLGWTAAVGGLLLLMSLASGWINRGPLKVFGLYLVAGIICGRGCWDYFISTPPSMPCLSHG